VTASPGNRRVLLKLSGESFADPEIGYGIDTAVVARVAEEIGAALRKDVQVAVVVGGGNIFRGVSEAAKGMDPAAADYMGMLATMMNALAMREVLEGSGVPTRVLSAIEMRQLAETYIRLRAERHLNKGRVVILGGGTGNPFFTTDTAAALRGVEMGVDVILKATLVDGVFDKDPNLHDDAVMFDELSYMDVISKQLGVMDLTAITLCKDNGLPLRVFNIREPGNITRAILGEEIGTLVH
jgi:uridylate kinase